MPGVMGNPPIVMGFAVFNASGGTTCNVTSTLQKPTATMAVDSSGFLWLFACTTYDQTCPSPLAIWNNLPSSAPTGCLDMMTCSSTCTLASTAGAGANANVYVGTSGSLYLVGSSTQYIFGSPAVSSSPPPSPPPPLPPLPPVSARSPPPPRPPGPNVATVRTTTCVCVLLRSKSLTF